MRLRLLEGVREVPANRTNAIEGLPPPSELGRQVQEWITQGLLTVDEGVAMLVRHYTGRAQA